LLSIKAEHIRHEKRSDQRQYRQLHQQQLRGGYVYLSHNTSVFAKTNNSVIYGGDLSNTVEDDNSGHTAWAMNGYKKYNTTVGRGLT
jgi:hypothetical protein